MTAPHETGAGPGGDGRAKLPHSDPAPTPPAAAAAPPARPRRHWVRAVIWTCGIAALLVGLTIPFSYWRYRFTYSMTNDGFVETRIVNLAPQITGLLVRVLVEENDHVAAGQTIAEIDPTPRQRELDLARAKFGVAEEQLNYARATLDRLEQE